MNNSSKKFATLCRVKRAEKNLTQLQPATLVGLEQSHLCRIETKANGILLETALKLSKALEFSLDELKGLVST